MKIRLTNRQRVVKFIEEYIIPASKKKDLDYNKVISFIRENTSVSTNIIEDELNQSISSGKMKLVLTIPDGHISDWIKDIKEQEQNDKEVEDILSAKPVENEK